MDGIAPDGAGARILMARRAARIDANQTEIVSALRKAGARVQSLAAVGGGVPDLLVGIRSDLYLLECKDGKKPPSARGLTDEQKLWHAAWSGSPVYVVKCVDEALRAVGVVKA